mmetsp:Transcript_23725/g.34100  ORF Transcript_23725/g.34100 Transcript_23725/m.34100 type:complete len:274 (-) Transcript_23725:690-1511(-)
MGHRERDPGIREQDTVPQHRVTVGKSILSQRPPRHRLMVMGHRKRNPGIHEGDTVPQQRVTVQCRRIMKPLQLVPAHQGLPMETHRPNPPLQYQATQPHLRLLLPQVRVPVQHGQPLLKQGMTTGPQGLLPQPQLLVTDPRERMRLRGLRQASTGPSERVIRLRQSVLLTRPLGPLSQLVLLNLQSVPQPPQLLQRTQRFLRALQLLQAQLRAMSHPRMIPQEERNLPTHPRLLDENCSLLHWLGSGWLFWDSERPRILPGSNSSERKRWTAA